MNGLYVVALLMAMLGVGMADAYDGLAGFVGAFLVGVALVVAQRSGRELDRW